MLTGVMTNSQVLPWRATDASLSVSMSVAALQEIVFAPSVAWSEASISKVRFRPSFRPVGAVNLKLEIVTEISPGWVSPPLDS